jgi:hypothetical protein
LLQILIAVAAVIAIWKKQRRASARSRGEGPAAARADPDEEERTRRVQAEIRRKIAQRGAWEDARADRAPPVAEPPPVADEAPSAVSLPMADGVPDLPVAPVPATFIQAVPASWEPEPASIAPTVDWLAELRYQRGVRRAMVLREILGPPVALR